MKCFYHPERDAVAQCSQCHKGLCSACAFSGVGTTMCQTDLKAVAAQEGARARGRIVGAWLFMGIPRYRQTQLMLVHARALVAKLA